MKQYGRWFRVLWVFDALVAGIAIYFFFAGLADGSVSDFNIGLWLGILLGLAVVLGGSLWLARSGLPVLAKLLLLVLALPGLMYGLFILLVVATGTRWN